MAARATWRGAVEVNNFPIHICLFPRIKPKQKSDSFRTIAPNGHPIHQFNKDSDGNEVDKAECGSGVEVGPDQFHVLDPEALETIKSAQRSLSVEPEQFCPKASLPLGLASATYVVTADAKVPGAEKSAMGLFNGLAGNDLAYVTKVTMRAGGRDSIVVLYTEGKRLMGATIPFEAELAEVPENAEFEVDKAAAKTFQTFLDATGIEVKDFDHSALTSDYAERRAKVIEAAVAGKKIAMPKAPEAKDDAPDLMAALEGAVKAAEGKKATKKAPAKKGASKAKAAA